MIKQEFFSFPSEVDGLTIQCVLTAPEGAIKGVVLMAHGVVEHKGRYAEMMQTFAEHGYVCAMNDHRGYGESIRAEEDLGYTYEKGAEGMVQDMRTLGNMLKKRYPGKKCFVYGHSMGSLCAMWYLKRYGNELSGVILSGLPADTNAVGMGLKYLKVRKLFKGGRFRDESVNKLVFNNYASKFRGETSLYAWLNSTPDAIKTYEDDPKCGFLATVDGYMALLELLSGAYDAKGWKYVNNMLPVFIAVGADDPCADGEEGAMKGENYLKKLGFVRAEHKAYKGMRHEIHNEKGREAVLDDMVNRLDMWM